ncbi:MAG: transposase [Comamonadaceae bacterium]|nr:transposase [Comamonadaceae bacterium]
MRCAWQTLHTFSHNDRQLQGTPGAIAVLHTNTRRLDYHPHVHLVVPAAAIDAEQQRWRTKRSARPRRAICSTTRPWPRSSGRRCWPASKRPAWRLPARHPSAWVVDCKSRGQRPTRRSSIWAAICTAGVIREKDILRLRPRPGRASAIATRRPRTVQRRTLPGADFPLAGAAARACPRAFGAPATSAFCTPTASA